MNRSTYWLFVLVAAVALATIMAKADEAPLKTGETVLIVGKDGKSRSFSHDDFAVVPRRRKKKVLAVAPKPAPAPMVCPEAAPAPKDNKNTVKLYAGVGPRGYETEIFSSSLHISQGYEFVMGVGYSRQLDRTWSVEAVGLTNYTALLGVGYSF